MTLRSGAALGALLLAGCGLVPGSVDRPSAFADCAQRWRATLDELGGRSGVLVVDADTGAELLAIAADEGFVPASNAKLLTAAVALHALGPAATLTTGLSHTGTVQAGELVGDLVLRGGGDPGFGPQQVASMVAALQKLGVRRVAGRVRVDDGWLGPEHRGEGWEWNDLDQDFAAPFGGLCWAGNVVVVTGADGAARRVPIADPTASARQALRTALADAGVTVIDGDVTTGWQRSVTVVASAPIAELLLPMLRDSDNLCAEQLWRSAARVATGDGSTASSARHAERLLRALGIDTTGMVQVDGSGLSRLSLVRPRQLVAVLSAMLRSPFAAPFFSALPRAGEGTLRERLGALGGRVRAKTGTLTRVAALSGVLDRGDGRLRLFSVVWNDFRCDPDAARFAIDRLVEALADVR